MAVDGKPVSSEARRKDSGKDTSIHLRHGIAPYRIEKKKVQGNYLNKDNYSRTDQYSARVYLRY